ncbi:MAG: hypothetical protein ACK5FV_07900 [Bacteroidota bacterium]|jgi:hypothetical protein|nr:hypothetical protein [Saprospiraceae bacterium]
MEYVVDTNVLLVANKLSDMSSDCAEGCVRFIESFWGQHTLVIDNHYLVLEEYMHKLNAKKSGIGDKFLKQILGRLGSVKEVPLTLSGISNYDFVEFPDTLLSVDIDPSDRKFIAISYANDTDTPIAQASDSKWIGWEDALTASGITVHFLCRGELSDIYHKKMG